MPERPVEFIGMIGTSNASEIRAAPHGPGVIDKAFVAATALGHEFAGFDRVLIGYFSVAADTFQVAAFAAHSTERLGLMLAHRPGFVAPTLAARQLASLDQFSDGRLAVHIISGGSDADQARDGDFLEKAERYARTDEYLDVLKLCWTSPRPFDHEGTYYRAKAASVSVRCLQRPHIPIYFGRVVGRSHRGGRQARRHLRPVGREPGGRRRHHRQGARLRRPPRPRRRDPLQRLLPPILGHTEAAAWDRAHRILDQAEALRGGGGAREPQNAGSQRLLAEAARGPVVDKRLWTELAALTGAPGNSTSLVGTPEQVCEAMLDYWDLGVTTFLIRGFDPLEDALEYGRDLIPLVRAATAARSAPATAAAAE